MFILFKGEIYMSKKIGLCLTGGGAKGAYQIGACQALEDLGLYQKVEAFSGTSIGAANSSVLASTDIETAKDIWFNIPDDALCLPKPLAERFKEDRLKALEKGIYSMDTFERVMMSKIDFNVLKNKEVFVTVSEVGEEAKGLFEVLISSYQHYIKKDIKAHYVLLSDLDEEVCLDAVKASCSIPIVFPAVVNEDKKYYDGGLFDNKPVKPLVEVGCDEVYIIDISFFKQYSDVSKEYPDVTFHIIKPSKSIGKILDFTPEHAKEIYETGYNDTMKYFKDLKTLSE